MSSAKRSRAGAWIDGGIGVAILVAVAIAVAIGAVEVAVAAVMVGIAVLGIRASFAPAADPPPAPDATGPRVLVIDVSDRARRRSRPPRP